MRRDGRWMNELKGGETDQYFTSVVAFQPNHGERALTLANG